MNVYLLADMPEGILSATGQRPHHGHDSGVAGTSFQAMRRILDEDVRVVRRHPAVDTVVAFTGGRHGHEPGAVVHLTASRARRAGSSADQVIDGLRAGVRARSRAPACTCRRPRTFASAAGRQTRSISTRFKATSLATLNGLGAPARRSASRQEPLVADVNSDQQNSGPDAFAASSTATRRPGWVSAPATSTRRSTTPLASARSRRSTRR